MCFSLDNDLHGCPSLRSKEAALGPNRGSPPLCRLSITNRWATPSTSHNYQCHSQLYEILRPWHFLKSLFSLRLQTDHANRLGACPGVFGYKQAPELNPLAQCVKPWTRRAPAGADSDIATRQLLARLGKTVIPGTPTENTNRLCASENVTVKLHFGVS